MRSMVMRVVLAAVTAAVSASPAMAQGITAAQADEMLKELRAIRQALERVTPPPGSRPAAVPGPPPSVRLPTVSGQAMGRPDAPLTMVEFTDLQCPFCKRFHDAIFERIKTEYIDKGLLRFVTRDFPLDMHAHADLAARASRCAGEQNHFWDFRATLLANSARLSPDLINAAAGAAKMDMKAFGACLDSTVTREALKRDLADGQAAGVEGTPTFIIGRTQAQGLEGVRVAGALPFENLDAMFKELLAQAAPKR